MRVRTCHGFWAKTEGCHIVVSRNGISLYDVSLACIGATHSNSVIIVAKNLCGYPSLDLARAIAHAEACGRDIFDPFSEDDYESWCGRVMTEEDFLKELRRSVE